MFGCLDKNACMNQTSKPSKEKNLVISFSLLMRLFEWCHEDAKDDVEMHKVMEKLVSFNDGVNPLTIDVYDCIIPETVKAEPNEVPEDWSDIEGGKAVQSFTAGFNVANQEEYEALPCSDAQDECCASEIGACLANAGVDLSNVRYSDVAPIIIQNRDNDELEGYGASNKEIESFWDGYEEVEPLQQGRWTEMNINDNFEINREQPTVISLCNDNEYCVEPCEETVDDDLMAQIEEIINMGRM